MAAALSAIFFPTGICPAATRIDVTLSLATSAIPTEVSDTNTTANRTNRNKLMAALSKVADVTPISKSYQITGTRPAHSIGGRLQNGRSTTCPQHQEPCTRCANVFGRLRPIAVRSGCRSKPVSQTQGRGAISEPNSEYSEEATLQRPLGRVRRNRTRMEMDNKCAFRQFRLMPAISVGDARRGYFVSAVASGGEVPAAG